MKHIFIINSHTTFLTAMGTVEYLQLKAEDVLFLYMRNYKNSVIHVPFKVIDISNFYSNIQNSWNETTAQKSIAKVDQFIDTLINQSFHLYTPHLAAILFKLLYTSKKCKHVAFLQEGAICQRKVFITNNSIINKLWIFKRLFWNKDRVFGGFWYISGSLYKQLFLDSYAINNEFFKNLPSHNHIIKWPQVKLDTSFSKDDLFFIFDGFVGNNIAEENIYLQNCQKLIFNYAGKSNFIKFHPEQSAAERETILSFFEEKKVKAVAMDDSIPMECIVSSVSKKTFIGFGSSILHFAVQYGHNVICHDDWLMESSQLYNKHHYTWGLVLFSEVYGTNQVFPS